MMHATNPLAILLRSFFNCSELREFVHSFSDGRRLSDHLPASGSTLAETASEAAQLLERWGVSTADLFARLHEHRPTRLSELTAFHRLNTEVPTTSNLRRAMSLELLASIDNVAVGVYRLHPGQVKLIGRSSEADIQFPGDLKKLSRLHAWVSWPLSGPMLQDLDSKNGTSINGRRVTRAPLRERDRVQLGETQLLIHEPDRTETADAPREGDTLS